VGFSASSAIIEVVKTFFTTSIMAVVALFINAPCYFVHLPVIFAMRFQRLKERRLRNALRSSVAQVAHTHHFLQGLLEVGFWRND